MIQLITIARGHRKVLIDTSLPVREGTLVVWRYSKNGYTNPVPASQYLINTRRNTNVLKPVIFKLQ